MMTSTNRIANQYWVSSSAWPYLDYGRAMALDCAVVRDRSIAEQYNKNS